MVAPASSILSQKTFKIFFRKHHLNVLKHFLFPRIDCKRDIIPAKIWFLCRKCWLANNMTGQADVRFCKLGGGWWLVTVNECIRRYLFPTWAKEAKKQKKKIMPELRLCAGISYTVFLNLKNANNTTLFSSWNMVLQPNFLFLHWYFWHRKKSTSFYLFISKFFIICSC